MSTIEVIYPTIKEQVSIAIEFESGLTIECVIKKSGIINKYPEIDLTKNHVGIYNQVKKLEDVVEAGDRVEIYRALIANPKEVRRKRAVKQKEAGIIK